MSTKIVKCPDCGLTLELAVEGEHSKADYDIEEWRRVCKRPHLDSPMWCLIQRDGTWPRVDADRQLQLQLTQKEKPWRDAAQQREKYSSNLTPRTPDLRHITVAARGGASGFSRNSNRCGTIATSSPRSSAQEADEFLTLDQAKDAVTRWLAAPFPGEARHARRITQIDQVS